tara:strand:- start:329 stop:481 length:153 start_codon:yes stop_codon:yes gene_type:complete
MITPDAPQAVTATAAPIKATVASWLVFCKGVINTFHHRERILVSAELVYV